MRQMPHPYRAILTVATLMGAVMGATGSPASAAAPTTAATAQTWYQSVLSDLAPLQTSFVNSLQAVSSWQDGHETAAKARRKVDAGLSPLELALGNVERLAPLPGYPEAKANYVNGIDLYLQSFVVIRAATSVRSAPLVKQLQRASTRIRELGDVTFDQGTAEIASLLGANLASADVQAASKIPDWSTQSLAPGQPLISRWRGTLAQSSGTQSAAGWNAAMASSGAPTQTTVGGAAGTSRRVSMKALDHLVGELDGSEVELSGAPGLAGYPQASGLLRIALLIDVESLLAKEASEHSSPPAAGELSSGARALAKIGGALRGEQ